MEIMIIDFDAKFSDYIKDWLDKNSNAFKDLDEVELRMPKIYEEWLNAPADWLSGIKPGEYFMDFEAHDLVSLMIRYMKKRIGIPDSLLDAISSKKEKSLPLLADIVLKNNLPDNIDIPAIKITALHLLDEIGPEKYIGEFIDAIMDDDINEGLAESMIDTIKEYANVYKQDLVNALNSTDNNITKKRLLDILCDLSFDDDVYEQLILMFKGSNEKALFASYLGKYGKKDAFEILIKALDWMNINYLDYIEIKNAIEELGEEISHSRDFDGDEFYESMKGLYND